MITLIDISTWWLMLLRCWL